MKLKKATIVYIIISIILIIGIVFTWAALKGRSSKQVTEAVQFVKRLEHISAIQKVDLDAKDFKEVKSTTANNSKVKFTLVTGKYGVDLDENYEVVGFLDQNIIIPQSEKISQAIAITKAEKYLRKMIGDEFEFKEAKTIESEDNPFYTISFYKFHKNYLCYSSEIILKINKFTGELVGYSGYTDQKVKYKSEINISEDEAKKIANQYLEKIDARITVDDKIDLFYVTVSDEISSLCYVIEATSEENNSHEIIIDADSGEIVKHSSKTSDIIPANIKPTS